MQWPSDHTENHFPLCYDFVWLNHPISHVLALQNSLPHTFCHILTAPLFLPSLTFQWCVDKDTKSLKIAKLYKCSIERALCLVCAWVVRILFVLFRRRSDIDQRQTLTLCSCFCAPKEFVFCFHLHTRELSACIRHIINHDITMTIMTLAMLTRFKVGRKTELIKKPKYRQPSSLLLAWFLLCRNATKTSSSLLICQNLRLHN